jgi:hypothetical protein
VRNSSLAGWSLLAILGWVAGIDQGMVPVRFAATMLAPEAGMVRRAARGNRGACDRQGAPAAGRGADAGAVRRASGATRPATSRAPCSEPGPVPLWGARQLCRADAFLLVSGLIWLCGHIQMETCWSTPRMRARPLLSARLEDRTQPDIDRLTRFIFKMILVTYKSDTHPPLCERPGNVGAAA